MKKCPPHHWICDDVAGGQSRGRCRHCGKVKMFDNYLPPVDTYRNYVTETGVKALGKLHHRRPTPSSAYFDSI